MTHHFSGETMSLYPNDSPSSKEEALAAQIDRWLIKAAGVTYDAYQRIMSLINKNPNFKTESGEFDPQATFAAFGAHTETGMTIEQLREAAQFLKAMVNRYTPGKIVDDIPEAIVTFPQAAVPEEPGTTQ
jgi:hypothetical protein